MGERERKRDAVNPGWKRLTGWAVLLAAVAVIPFLPAARGPFLFDDVHTVVENPFIKAIDIPLFFSDPIAFSTKAGNWPYRPVILVVNSIQYALSGLDSLPWHCFQVFMHFINSFLVMIVARRIFGLERGALIAGLLFALAPLQSQAVNYISSRSMVIACAPMLFAVISMNTAARSKKTRQAAVWGTACIFCSALAFLSSDGSLALVMFLPLGLYVSKIDLRNKRIWVIFAGVLAAAGVFMLLRTILIPGPLLGPHPRVAPPYTPMENAALQLRYPWLMTRLLAIPVHLSILHHAPAPQSMFDPKVILPIIGYVALGAALALVGRRRALAAATGWYLAALLPSVLVPLNIAWAEHRTYLALPGLVIAVGYMYENLVSALETEKRLLPVRLARACMMSVLVFFFLLTYQRSMVWSDPKSLYADATRKAPLYDVPWSFMANEKRMQLDFKQALKYINRTISLNPYFADAYGSRSDILIKLGRYNEAADSARRAVELAPENGTYWNNLATAYMFMERWQDAEPNLRAALERTPPYHPNRRIVEKNWAVLQRKKREAEH